MDSPDFSAEKPSAAKASAWNALDIVLRQGIQFVISIVLARLLTPEDFGIVALLSFFTSLSIVFLQSGLTVAIIQRQHTSRAEESAIFWWNLGGSGVFALLLLASGPWLASFYGQPVLTPLAGLAATQILLSTLGAVQTALLTRQLRFDLIAKAGAIASFGSGAIGIAAAMMGAGVWALALQMATSALLNSLALWILTDWRPQLHFRFGTIRGLLGFGAWISLGNIMDVLYTHGFALLLGKLHGIRELGLYNRAAATQLLPSTILTSLVSRVSLPLFAAAKDDLEALREGVRIAIGTVMLVNVPVMLGLALLAKDIIAVLFGERWLPAAPILSILAISGILIPFHIVNLQLVLARAQSRTFVANEIWKKAIGIVCVVIGSIFGILGLALGQVAYSILALFVNARPAQQIIGYGPLRQLRDISGIFVAAAAMTIAIFLLKPFLPPSPLLALLLCTVTGGAIYVAIGWGAGFRVFREPASLLAQEVRNWRPQKNRPS